MKKLFTFFLVSAIFVQISFSQKKNLFLTSMDFTIYSSNYKAAKEKLSNFTKKPDVTIIRMNETKTNMTAEFSIDNKMRPELDSLVNTLGYVTLKNVTTTSSEDQYEKAQTETKYLNEKKQTYETEIQSMPIKNEKYYSYWDEIQNTNKRLFELETDLTSYNNQKITSVIITLYDDAVDVSENTISWVNMPGVSFDFLSIETPLSGVTAQQYMGYSLKYLVTKGKSYFTLGNLKEFSSEPKDSMRFTEFFHTGFGQDFYTKHFGRGKRTWFNLYTGYNAGVLFATADLRNTTLPYSKVYLGVELFKNRYILIDNKIGYFVPFKYNRNMRGLEYNFSFNFVF
jgi:molecular chaperone GrpE (heat shock protein)